MKHIEQLKTLNEKGVSFIYTPTDSPIQFIKSQDFDKNDFIHITEQGQVYTRDNPIDKFKQLAAEGMEFGYLELLCCLKPIEDNAKIVIEKDTYLKTSSLLNILDGKFFTIEHAKQCYPFRLQIVPVTNDLTGHCNFRFHIVNVQNQRVVDISYSNVSDILDAIQCYWLYAKYLLPLVKEDGYTHIVVMDENVCFLKGEEIGFKLNRCSTSRSFDELDLNLFCKRFFVEYQNAKIKMNMDWLAPDLKDEIPYNLIWVSYTYGVYPIAGLVPTPITITMYTGKKVSPEHRRFGIAYTNGFTSLHYDDFAVFMIRGEKDPVRSAMAQIQLANQQHQNLLTNFSYQTAQLTAKDLMLSQLIPIGAELVKVTHVSSWIYYTYIHETLTYCVRYSREEVINKLSILSRPIN